MQKGWLLALGMVSTAAPSISYVNIVFNAGTRWLVLLALLAHLVLTRRLLVGLRGQSAFFGYALLIYAVMSTFWSTLPELSGPKSLAYLLAAICYSSAGAVWAMNTARRDVLNVMWPLILLSLIAGVGGVGFSGATVQMNDTVKLYRGLANNSNFLGLLIVAVLPLPLWMVAQSETNKRQRQRYYLLLFILSLLLLKTFSRASILASGIIVLFYLIGTGTRRLTLVFVAVMALVLALPVLFPQQSEQLLQRYIFKGADESASVFASRDQTWSASLKGAEEGAIFGLGFGVSYGYNDYVVGLKSSGYGREKANVSLAIIEEVGLLGFALFLGLIQAVMMRTRAAIRIAQRKEDKVLLYILLGSILAMLVHSQFEAWLFSPGGAATPVFWAMIGMTITVSRQVLREWRVAHSAERVGHWQQLASAQLTRIKT